MKPAGPVTLGVAALLAVALLAAACGSTPAASPPPGRRPARSSADTRFPCSPQAIGPALPPGAHVTTARCGHVGRSMWASGLMRRGSTTTIFALERSADGRWHRADVSAVCKAKGVDPRLRIYCGGKHPVNDWPT